MKYTFTRPRPSEDPDPNHFFQGHGHQSFPSGEVAEISAVVTPFIAEYHTDHPAVWALTLLPAYDAVARVKVHGHWQSDVLVGAGVGVAWGIWAHHRKTPLIMTMPNVGEFMSVETMISDSNDAVTVNGAHVVSADVAASNGVIHAIDKVLIPGG